MQQVNMYTHTSIKGPKKRSGVYGFVLELETKKGEVTLTKLGTLDLATEHQANMLAIIAAAKRLNRTCSLNIYTQSTYLINAFKNDWVKNWQKNDWKNAKGEDVANKTEWQELCKLLDAHVFHVEQSSNNKYQEWLEREVAKKEKEKSHV